MADHLANEKKALLNDIDSLYRKYDDLLKGNPSPDLIQEINSINFTLPENNFFDEHVYRQIFKILTSETVNRHVKTSVAYLGPEGTFSHSALMEIFNDNIIPLSQKTIPDVFHAIEIGEATAGVVPIENSTEGAVTFTLDELLDKDLFICGEHYLKISYTLLSREKNLNKIKRVYTHPQSIGQCKGWIQKNLPHAEVVEFNSTAQSAQRAASEAESAAIGSALLGKLYNLDILAEKLEDSLQNFTRFLVIGKKDNEPTGNDKTSIICSLKDKPGALHELLKYFQQSGINMTKIESRPNKRKAWEYNFYIDFLGHRLDSQIAKTLTKMAEHTMFIKVLGSYPVEERQDNYVK